MHALPCPRAPGGFSLPELLAVLAAAALLALLAWPSYRGTLQRVRTFGSSDAFDCGDRLACGVANEDQAGVHRNAVEEHRARRALALIATLLAAGEAEALAQRVEQ